MKKIYILGALAVAATALFSCNKEQEVIINDNAEGTPFEIVAGTEATKTVNDGVHTTWAEGDGIALFHAVSGQSVYVSDSLFTAVEAGANVVFSGKLKGSLSEDNYDWFAIYPFNKNIGTPANTGDKGYVTVGSASNASQSQAGNNSMAHIAGTKYPVAGKALNVAKDDKPAITMTHLTSLVAVEVTNGTSGPISVSNVSFTGTEDIIGTFFIDFVSSPVVYTKSGDTYVSSTASLNVTNGEAIASGEKATFYLAVKPFTAPAGETITLSVTADNGTQTVTSSALSSAFSFVAGKKHKLSFNYTKAPSAIAEPTSKTGWYRLEKSDWLNAGDRVVIVNHDGTKAMSKVQKSNNRDGVDVSVADDGAYKKLTSNDNVQVFIVEDGTASGSFAFWCENGDEASKYIYAASSSSNYLRSQLVLDANASFVLNIPDGVGSLTAQGSNTRKVLQYNNLFSCYTSATYDDVSIYKYYGTWTGSTTCANPTITQNGTTVSIACTTPGVKIYYTTDGTTPTAASTLYEAPFAIASPVTVKAIAVRSHYTDSGISSKACTLKAATPVISGSGTAFSITCATDGATIYYETSTSSMGAVTTPTTSSAVFSSAVAIVATTYVKAIAVKDGYDNSDVASNICEYVSGSSSSSFVFNTSAGLTALGITAPAQGKGTDLDPNKNYLSGAITMNVTHGGTNTRIWNSSGTLTLRVYKSNGSKPDGTMTFDAGSGKTITKIDFTASSLTATPSTGTLSSKTWTGSSQAVTFTCTANSIISTIEVTYTN